MAHMVNHQPLSAEAFTPGLVHVGAVVDEVPLGQAFLKVLWFYPVSIIPPWLFILMLSSEG
jgi:hypothetical protein